MPFVKKPDSYLAWQQMRFRCTNPNHANWHRYGGRGITFAPQWEEYSVFARDMGPRPPGTSLDRINNDGNYEPGNCRWATKKEQSQNHSRVIFVEIEGKRYKALELSEQYGVKTATIVYRAKRGMPFTKVVSQEKFKRENPTMPAKAWQNSARNRMARTHCIHGHAFTPENTIWRKPQEGRVIETRECRACAVELNRKRRLKRELEPCRICGKRTKAKSLCSKHYDLEQKKACPKGHAYTPENTRISHLGIRYCLACAANKGRKSAERWEKFRQMRKAARTKLAS